jgi:hypothetical protein
MVPTPDTAGFSCLTCNQSGDRGSCLAWERRVDLAARRIKVVDVRYDAGRFGSGYKDRPKSDVSIRPLPMAEQVTAAMTRRLSGFGRDELVFCGPGGSNGVPRVPGRLCRSATSAASTGWRWPGPSCPTWIRTAPRSAPYVRDLARGWWRPGPGARRVDGPPGRPPGRARGQHDRHALPRRCIQVFPTTALGMPRWSTRSGTPASS